MVCHSDSREHGYSRAVGLLDAVVTAQNRANGKEIFYGLPVFYRVEIIVSLYAKRHILLFIEEIF